MTSLKSKNVLTRKEAGIMKLYLKAWELERIITNAIFFITGPYTWEGGGGAVAPQSLTMVHKVF